MKQKAQFGQAPRNCYSCSQTHRLSCTHAHTHTRKHQKLVRDREGESIGSCIKLDSFRSPWPALTLVKCGFKASRHIVHAYKCTLRTHIYTQKHTHIKCSRRQGCNFGLGHRCHLCRSLAPLAAEAGLPWGGLWSGLAWCGMVWWDLSSIEVGSGVLAAVAVWLLPLMFRYTT